MFSSPSRLRRAILCTIIGIGWLGFHAALNLAAQPKPAQQKEQKPANPRIINVKELKPEQFRELFPTWPDDTTLEADGQRVTVGELRAKMQQQHAAAGAKVSEAARKAAVDLERRRAELQEREKARLEAGRKEALAYFEHLPKPPAPDVQAEVQAIREEMWNLREKLRTAGPKERDEILRRADELVHKYGRLTAPPKPQ